MVNINLEADSGSSDRTPSENIDASNPSAATGTTNSAMANATGLEALLWEPLAFARLSWVVTQLDLTRQKNLENRHLKEEQLDALPVRKFGVKDDENSVIRSRSSSVSSNSVSSMISDVATSSPTSSSSSSTSSTSYASSTSSTPPPPPSSNSPRIRYNNLGDSNLGSSNISILDDKTLQKHNEQYSNSSNLSSSWEMISSSVVLDPNAPVISPPSTPEMTTHKSNTHNQDINTCVICLDVFNLFDDIKTLPCGHIFHQNCIDTWLSGRCSEDSCFTNICPTCKSFPAANNCVGDRLGTESPDDLQCIINVTDSVLSSQILFPSSSELGLDSEEGGVGVEILAADEYEHGSSPQTLPSPQLQEQQEQDSDYQQSHVRTQAQTPTRQRNNNSKTQFALPTHVSLCCERFRAKQMMPPTPPDILRRSDSESSIDYD